MPVGKSAKIKNRVFRGRGLRKLHIEAPRRLLDLIH